LDSLAFPVAVIGLKLVPPAVFAAIDVGEDFQNEDATAVEMDTLPHATSAQRSDLPENPR
jgi:predicted metalloprotease